jgi:hypothetical protein
MAWHRTVWMVDSAPVRGVAGAVAGRGEGMGAVAGELPHRRIPARRPPLEALVRPALCGFQWIASIGLLNPSASAAAGYRQGGSGSSRLPERAGGADLGLDAKPGPGRIRKTRTTASGGTAGVERAGDARPGLSTSLRTRGEGRQSGSSSSARVGSAAPGSRMARPIPRPIGGGHSRGYPSGTAGQRLTRPRSDSTARPNSPRPRMRIATRNPRPALVSWASGSVMMAVAAPAL